MPSKLVRDNIPDIIALSGKRPQTHIATNDEYKQKLLEKLYEEVNEFTQEPSLEELADIHEVLEAICTTYSLNINEVKNVQKTKKEKRGGFSKKIILDSI